MTEETSYRYKKEKAQQYTQKISPTPPALFSSSSTLGKVSICYSRIRTGLPDTLISPRHGFQKEISKVQV